MSNARAFIQQLLYHSGCAVSKLIKNASVCMCLPFLFYSDSYLCTLPFYLYLVHVHNKDETSHIRTKRGNPRFLSTLCSKMKRLASSHLAVLLSCFGYSSVVNSFFAWKKRKWYNFIGLTFLIGMTMTHNNEMMFLVNYNTILCHSVPLCPDLFWFFCHKMLTSVLMVKFSNFSTYACFVYFCSVPTYLDYLLAVV